MASNLRHLTDFLASGRDLNPAQAEEVFIALQSEHDEEIIANVLLAWNSKGPSVEEIYSLAIIMRGRAQKVRSVRPMFVDTAGTGSSRIKTFNISTAAAFVIAGAGVPVAKHGNRAATSRSGSADVISELGVNINIEPCLAGDCLDNIGMCFMFAPQFHSLSLTLGKVRRALGAPTIFNILGPLCNPAAAPHQIIGVWEAALVEKAAKVVARLGTQKTWVVNGGGLDEITLDGETKIAEVTGNIFEVKTVAPVDFGMTVTSLSSLEKPSPAESAALIRDILSGRCNNEVAANLVVINAAAAIYVCGVAESLPEARLLAEKSISSGSALAKLEALREATNS